jgi:hypothetical protein
MATGLVGSRPPGNIPLESCEVVRFGKKAWHNPPDANPALKLLSEVKTSWGPCQWFSLGVAGVRPVSRASTNVAVKLTNDTPEIFAS